MVLTYGFRIVGTCRERRRPIDWAAAFSGYASLDDRADVQREAYLSAFLFGDDFLDYLESIGSTKGYRGACWAPWLWLDIDRADKLEQARQDAARLAYSLIERYRLDDDTLLIFFSGSKGFHVGLPTALWLPEPSETFHRIARHFAESFAASCGVVIDAGVYANVQAFRAPNSRHPKTGRHKRRLSLDELTRLSVPSIIELAAQPAVFDVPETQHRSEQAAADWQAARELVRSEAEATAIRRAEHSGTPTLNKRTLEFIREGAGSGDRHRLLFSAAANLAEFGCPAALAHALLTEGGLDSGLPPREVARQIDCGLNHVPKRPAQAGKLFPDVTGGGYYDAGL